MPKGDNQSVKSAKMRLAEKMQERYPDRKFAGENGEISEISEETLHDSILETLEDLSARDDEYKAKNSALNDLFYSDPQSAEFVQKWIQTGDPRAALIETFGDELSELATDEGRGKWKGNLESWRTKRSENDALNAESEANWSKSLEDLEAWGNEKGLNNEQKVNIMLRLVGIAANGLVNKYEPADFDMVLKEMNYDADMSTARHEGEVTGRNAKIDENKRRRQEVSQMPPTLSGQGGKIRKEESKSIFAQANDLV